MASGLCDRSSTSTQEVIIKLQCVSLGCVTERVRMPLTLVWKNLFIYRKLYKKRQSKRDKIFERK